MTGTDDSASPALSVIIPVYNRRELVLRAVVSVLDQHTTLTREVIVVDDGSTDDTCAAIQQRFNGDARVRLIRADHGGASAARNRGLREARGSWLGFLDSDDYWLPGMLAAVEWVFACRPQLAFVCVEGATLATPEQALEPRIVAAAPGWSHAQFRRVRLAKESCAMPESGRFELISGDFFPAILFGDLFYLSGMLMRCDAVLAAGSFNERFRFFNDWEFFARLCRTGNGAYACYDGFRRDSGRADQISRRGALTAMPRRHLYIVRSLLRRDDTREYTRALRLALADACYVMARALTRTGQSRRARGYLLFCLRRRYKFFRALALLLTPRR